MTPILSGATATGAGAAVSNVKRAKTYQANGATTSGSGAAAVNVEGSLNGANWDVIGTISLTLGTASTSDSFASTDAYDFIRGNVTAISGTGASVNLSMGY